MENDILSIKKEKNEVEKIQDKINKIDEKGDNLKLKEKQQIYQQTFENLRGNEPQKTEENNLGKVNAPIETQNSQKDDVSKGFYSPPAFHLTEIIHDGKCFKKTQGHITVEISGDICIYGGYAEDKYTNNFIRYIPGINLFEKMRLNSNDIQPRAFCSGNVITEDNKKSIVIFGGINENKSAIDETCKFDFQAKKWQIINNKVNPCPRYKHASFSFEDVLYIHGGLDSDENPLSDLWLFSNNIWKKNEQGELVPGARYGHSLAFSLYGNTQLAFLFGGNKKGFNGALSDTWLFNIKTNRWKLVQDSTGSLPCARWGHSAQIFDNKWMIIYGGITNGWLDSYALSDMYAMNIYTFSWFEIDISTSKNFDRGYYGSLCLLPYKKSLFIFGGTDNSKEYFDVFSMTPLVTYISYKTLTGEIEQLNDKMKKLSETTNENENSDLLEFDVKISELKEEVNNISNMMKTFETKFYELEKLNEQCERILSKDINSEDMEKLEERIKKLESLNQINKENNEDLKA